MFFSWSDVVFNDQGGQRVELHVWHSSVCMTQPQILTTRTGVFVWAFDSAQYEEDAAAVANDILVWSKMIEQSRVKRAPMFIVALAHDDSFSSALHDLESSLRSQLPLPAPSFVLLSHKAAGTSAASVVRQICTVASKRRIAFMPVASSWLSLAESLSARFVDDWGVLTLTELVATAQGFGVEESQARNALRFLHENTTSLWWFEDTASLQDMIFCNPPAVASFCLRLADMLRAGTGSDGVMVASVERLWNRELREGLRLPFLRLLMRLDLVIEISPGKWFVPGALSDNPISRDVALGTSLPYREFVAREYEFAFVPEPFFHHFCAKVFWFSEATVESVWKRGLEIRLLPSKSGKKEEVAKITWDPTRRVLKFLIETRYFAVFFFFYQFKPPPPPRRSHAISGFHIHKDQLLRFLVDTAESLARSTFRAKFSIKIPCNHCLADPNLRAAPFQFSYQAVVDALMSNARTLPCQGLT